MKLTRNLKKQVEQADTKNEKKDIIENAGMLLNNDELDQVAGGEIFESSDIPGHNPEKPWEILDDKGNVLDCAATGDDAIWLASCKGVSRKEVTWDDVLNMRGQK